MGFRKISIPNNLVDKIEQAMRKTDRYRSIAEFVGEAARLRLEQLERELSGSPNYSVASHVLTREKEKCQP
jgi:Arc/MetJ-type ribon-helix-helix transcriptional regulator